jgi:hypothetical protein
MIFSFIPDWLVFVLGFIILLVIYYYLPDDIKTAIKKFLRSYGIYIIFFLIWIYWHSQTGTIAESPEKWPADLNRASFFVGLGLILFVAFRNWLYEFRFYTHQFIGDNIHGSCHRYEAIGNVGGKQSKNPWVVAFLGGSGLSDESWVMPWPFIKKIAVFPLSTFELRGNQMISHAKFEMVTSEELLELDEDVSEFIKNDTFGKWAKDNVWVGYASINKLASDPNYNDLKEELKKKNARITELKLMLTGKMSAVKGFVYDAMGIGKKLKGQEYTPQRTQMESGM